MPTEMRQITFRSGEVTTAIAEYHRRRGLSLPAGSINQLEVIDGPAIKAVLSVEGERGLTAIDISGEMLAAALILYCINRGIPLPAGAEKRLQKVGDSVALLVLKRLD